MDRDFDLRSTYPQWDWLKDAFLCEIISTGIPKHFSSEWNTFSSVAILSLTPSYASLEKRVCPDITYMF